MCKAPVYQWTVSSFSVSVSNERHEWCKVFFAFRRHFRLGWSVKASLPWKKSFPGKLRPVRKKRGLCRMAPFPHRDSFSDSSHKHVLMVNATMRLGTCDIELTQHVMVCGDMKMQTMRCCLLGSSIGLPTARKTYANRESGLDY
ncbi:hypothetical protein COCON_G00081760 [Conger conger]|uniref:Uncharacterized protein n=1 Tax=Conger conger TaxID=82655 RepID=A0A9Q1I0Z7_CONCO|nr:hypothetical protein COCON_G00081760 [Conger conger]